MSDEGVLTAAQRTDLAAFAGVDGSGTDAGLLEAAADRIGMTGEMSIDPDGVVELLRGDILVALESVTEEDRGAVEHPDQLQLAVFLRVGSEEERAEMEDHGLIEAADDLDEHDEEWGFAAWGAMCTRLSREATLSQQMQVLERAMVEAERVMEDGEVDRFHENLSDLRHAGDG